VNRLLFVVCAVPLRGCNEPPPKAQVRPVRTVVVQRLMAGDSVTLTGQVQAENQSSFSFRIAGRLLERNVSVGDPVAPGQVVAKIEPQDLQNALRSAEADLSSAKAVLLSAQNSESRQSDLLSKGFTTRAQYEQSQQVLGTAQAQVFSAEAKLQNARDNLSYTELKSDVSGTVTAKGAEPGEVVAAGRMVLQVARVGGRDAVFNIPPALIRTAPKNPDISVVLSDDPSITAKGYLRELAPQADAITGTYVVKVGLIDPPATMRLGATVIGRMMLGSDSAIRVPGTALTQLNGKPAVWIVDPATKKVALRAVTVTRYEPASVVISDGLNDGELVVSAGVQTLRPEQEVRLLEPVVEARQ
jgi:RND family efflux transporter MFP subunit